MIKPESQPLIHLLGLEAPSLIAMLRSLVLLLSAALLSCYLSCPETDENVVLASQTCGVCQYALL